MGKYIKSYEEQLKLFEPINISEWLDFVKNIISINHKKVSSVLPSDIKWEVRKTINVANNVRRRRMIDNPSVVTNEKVDYMIVNINGHPVFIYEKEDEYYGVYFSMHKYSKCFKCDQIEGLISCLEYLKSKV